MSPQYRLKNSILALVLVFFGCQPDEKVTVSGAVAKPGAYRYVPGRPAADYLADAGGATEEAMLDEAHVSRARPDASAAVPGDLTTPLSGNPPISPGDEIRIPSRVYDVRMDTVRLMKNVRLVDRNRIYRIPSGALVNGWTERGVQVALLLGRGKAYERPDTALVVSAFHYLYIRLHPGEYPRLARFAGEVVDSLEALEDADTIQKSVVHSLKYLRDGGLQLPPVGYWRVMKGVFLAPRSASRPGSGMRRRRFEDGRVWTTFPDGRQRWQFPDGRTSVRFPKGSSEDRYPDGRVVYTDRRKNQRISYPDGRREWRMATGTRVHQEADGRVAEHHPDGVPVQRLPDGTTPGAPSDVPVETREAGGTAAVPDPAEERTKGTASGGGPDAAAEGRSPESSSGRAAPAPRSALPASRGRGSLLIVPSDRGRPAQAPRVLTRETLPDGRLVETGPAGQTFTSWPDGSMEVRMPPAYEYPGPLRTDLATVDRLPEAVAVGEELTVSGQVHGEVEGVYVMGFLVPDGDAIEGDVVRRGRRFHARFRFGEAGHCRVQVQVVLPGARTYTASHQSVIVGNPGRLEDEVLAIAPYPGDEAAQLLLIDRINAARKRIRRGSVFPHPELMHVARIRLEEMLAMGFVSHFSMTGLDAGWHTDYRRLPFRRVGENVARTRFVETMHAGWMLSAGHRANILAKHWTHVGVAVAEAEGSVWGVQVFGQGFDRGP
ncbi:MAG: SLBB domain-containing protein [Gemmatimonadota bacterium]|nr:SLBB domain-containing protein [Gemmatimonadota bacterium]